MCITVIVGYAHNSCTDRRHDKLFILHLARATDAPCSLYRVRFVTSSDPSQLLSFASLRRDNFFGSSKNISVAPGRSYRSKIDAFSKPKQERFRIIKKDQLFPGKIESIQRTFSFRVLHRLANDLLEDSYDSRCLLGDNQARYATHDRSLPCYQLRATEAYSSDDISVFDDVYTRQPRRKG